jgi:hypothetical protein
MRLYLCVERTLVNVDRVVEDLACVLHYGYCLSSKTVQAANLSSMTCCWALHMAANVLTLGARCVSWCAVCLKKARASA